MDHFTDVVNSKIQVLVVDDDDAIRESVAYALELEGYSTHSASNGLRALELLDELRNQGTLVDLIFLDIMMPRLNGWEFLEQVRSQRHYQGIPIIIITAAGSSERLSGATTLLSKPFELEALIEITKKHTQRMTDPSSAKSAEAIIPQEIQSPSAPTNVL